MKPILVFDLETIPDLTALRQLQRAASDESDATIVANAHLDEQPLKPAFQQIVAIAAAWITPDGAMRRLTSLGHRTWDERQLVKKMFDVIAESRPQLVGWNSSGFDLPVLIYRAMVHHVSVPAFYQTGTGRFQNYRYRFDEDWHIDLMDILSNYGASAKLKLDEMAAILGIPGKIGVDGSHVLPLYQSGQLDAIRTYCESDVLTTTLVYARYAEHRGWWTDTHMATFESSVAAWLDSQSGPTWDEWRARWQPGSQILGQLCEPAPDQTGW
ncbi:3'-5' exonuclease [Sulfobacillus sp. hq2]|uniref:3'-5' exonuclease n=1 Tax=Sulfobacillus TaxID=28033 RepID=UPI000CD1EC91|nr:ribonuclease H-like domain-containing protein [Sulfobacillus sp. hq2]POB10113.1 3'-5' exonuclease [Sulfobacillus sp. hq2]